MHILSIEDNPADTTLLKEWFSENLPDCQVSFVGDGVQALEFLYRRGDFTQVTLPDLVLLDLNIPKVDGREILRQIKGHPELKRLPVLVLTTSNSERDVLDVYDLGANAFISKPLDLDEVDAMLSCVGKFWLGTARLPRRK